MMVCLVCYDDDIVKTIFFGKDVSMSSTRFINHFRQHTEEYQQYIGKKQESKLLDISKCPSIPFWHPLAL